MIALAPDGIVLIIALAALAAAAAAAIGLLLLRFGRRWRLASQLRIVVLAPIASVTAALLAVSSAMFLSPHDLTVALWILAVATAVSLVVASLLGRSFLRTTRTLVRAARTVGGTEAGGVPAAAHRPGPRSTELAQLATELEAANRRLAMARLEVERADASRRELVAWVSHDLRTPLASARAMAEALEDGLVDDPARYHRGIRQQVDRLSDLVDDLFELSKLSAGTMQLQRSAVSVYDLVSDQIADFGPVAEERFIRIAASGDLDATVDADPRLLSRALGNLIANAVTYSPPGGLIAVAVRMAGDTVEIGVTDEGGGIRSEDLPRVFDAGWRADEARTAGRTTGAGLGLAIVRGIAEAHAGSVEAGNEGGGSRFVLRLASASTVG